MRVKGCYINQADNLDASDRREEAETCTRKIRAYPAFRGEGGTGGPEPNGPRPSVRANPREDQKERRQPSSLPPSLPSPSRVPYNAA